MSLEEKGQNFIQRFLDNHGNTKIGEISSRESPIREMELKNHSPLRRIELCFF